MLKNELQAIEGLFMDCHGATRENWSGMEFPEVCQQVQEAWLNAVFSDMPQERLARYFNYHLEGISNISDTLFRLKTKAADELQHTLLSLIDHIEVYYRKYIDMDTNAPAAFHARLVNRLAAEIHGIREGLQVAGVDDRLINCILCWLDDMSVVGLNVHYTFRSLSYMVKLVHRIAGLNWHSADIEHQLVLSFHHADFNHLSFLTYLQNQILSVAAALPDPGEKLDYLQRQKAEMMSCPREINTIYDPSWPPVRVMMAEWLNEEIFLTETAIKNSRVETGEREGKLKFNMSVAYLACLIKLFYEEGLFGSQNLSAIFKFFAANCESKKQMTISAMSLSKELYTLDHHTAAHVLEILKRMMARINRDFFPVWAVTGIIILFR
jgi:hypothetical protein